MNELIPLLEKEGLRRSEGADRVVIPDELTIPDHPGASRHPASEIKIGAWLSYILNYGHSYKLSQMQVRV